MTRLGILGGGQLAQMLTQAAISLGIETVIFERHADSPAGRFTRHEFVGAWTDKTILSRFLGECDLVTLENEFVDGEVLRKMTAQGASVFPDAGTLENIQDKLIQKETMHRAGVPVAEFSGLDRVEGIEIRARAYGYPMILKARRDSYDGYGNRTINSPEDSQTAWDALSIGGRELMLEAYVPFERELAVMVVRGRTGEMQTYPVVETIQHNHICHVVRAPAAIAPDLAAKAKAIAEKAVKAVNGVGVFGVELFLLPDGDILFNEIAPRPHNSGHYTIEACMTSQFENHLRAVLGWSLGATAMRVPAAVMVNILGKREGEPKPDALRQAAKIAGAHIHLYGKRAVRVGRKMGHVTVLGDSHAAAEAIAQAAARLIEEQL